MKYYCKNCESVFETIKENVFYNYNCPSCDAYYEWDEIKLPDYETPEQYEKRTGNEWPDDAPVWYRHLYNDIDPETKQRTGINKYTRWLLNDYHKARQSKIMCGLGNRDQIICCQSPVPPPDDWRPE